VSSAEQYRSYANECIAWAKTARTERERKIFLEMARTWTEAALIAKKRDALSKTTPNRTHSTRDKDDNASA
jgi:hypothetical protein